MDQELFNELVESLRYMKAVERSQAAPSREFVFTQPATTFVVAAEYAPSQPMSMGRGAALVFSSKPRTKVNILDNKAMTRFLTV